MSLTKAIQFRQLLAYLTVQEKSQFLSDFLQSHPDVVSAALFHHFAHDSKQIQQVIAINQSLSNLILQRKEKPKRMIASSTKIKLQHLPRALIGYLASFLDERAYFNFSGCNRYTHLGCNTPNALQALTILPHAVPLSHVMNDKPKFNKIKSLTLNAQREHEWVQQFLNQNIVNGNTVTELHCLHFGCVDQAETYGLNIGDIDMIIG
eukprot:55822_1